MRGFSRSLGAFRNRQIRKSIRRDMRYYGGSSGCIVPIAIIIVLSLLMIEVIV